MKAALPYRQVLDDCFEARIGDAGLDEKTFAAALAETAPVLDELRQVAEAGTWPHLRLPELRDDLPELRKFADWHVRNHDRVLVLGTGGSSLGAQTVCALAGSPLGPAAGRPHLVFVDNIDPELLATVLNGIDPARTGVLAVSKSGGTAETLAQMLACLDRFEGQDPAARFTVVTEPGDNVLGALADARGIHRIAHDPDLGGRYSVLSCTGVLPALIAGLDVEALRDGAAAALRAALASGKPGNALPAAGAALAVAFLRRGIGTSVMLCYGDRLRAFGDWYAQIWAESLGKNGRGMTPVPAVGTVDQHSQLQLWLDGPPDKLYTVVLADRAGTGPRIDPMLAADSRLDYLAGRTVGDLMEAEQRATAQTLADRRRPVRILRVSRLDERSLGAMMMHLMLETIIAGRLLGVDPFDQPAVEQGKVLARRYMREGPA